MPGKNPAIRYSISAAKAVSTTPRYESSPSLPPPPPPPPLGNARLVYLREHYWRCPAIPPPLGHARYGLPEVRYTNEITQYNYMHGTFFDLTSGPCTGYLQYTLMHFVPMGHSVSTHSVWRLPVTTWRLHTQYKGSLSLHSMAVWCQYTPSTKQYTLSMKAPCHYIVWGLTHPVWRLPVTAQWMQDKTVVLPGLTHIS